MELLNNVWSGNIVRGHPLDKISPSVRFSQLSKFRKLRGAAKTKGVLEFFQSQNPFRDIDVLQKSADHSAELRTKGNFLYKSKLFKEALKAYNLALCFSPPNSMEFYLAIANRSALFFQLGEYDVCKADLNLVLNCALDSTEVAQLKVKLQHRWEKCSSKSLQEQQVVNNPPAVEPGARGWAGGSEAFRAGRKQVLEYFSLKNPSANILSAEDFLAVKSNRDRGRHVVTRKHVPPGTLLIVEDPFAKILLHQYRWDVNHCHTCLHPISNGIPCNSCVFEIFCSSVCAESRDMNLCQISSHLHVLNPSRNLLLATKIVTHQGPEKLFQLFQTLSSSSSSPSLSKSQRSSSSLEKRDSTSTRFDEKEEDQSVSGEENLAGFTHGVYASDDYIPIYNLIYHEADTTELFQYTLDAVAIVQALTLFSQFFSSVTELDPQAQNQKENEVVEDFKLFLVDLIVRHLRNLPPNAHSLNELQDLNLVEYGAGAYALLSLINHSCDPNVTRFNLPNGRVAVVSVKSIQMGGELLDNYGVHYAVNTFLERQKHLTKHYYFNCDCVPCMKNWPLYKELKFRDQISMFNVYGYNEVSTKFDNLFESVMKNEDICLQELLECLVFFETHFQLPFSKFNEAQETFKHYVNVTIRKIFGPNEAL